MYINVCANNINITVDTTGPLKGPNRVGYDIFNFRVNDKDELIPWDKYTFTPHNLDVTNSDTSSKITNSCSYDDTTVASGFGCALYAMQDRNPADNSQGYWDSLR